MDDAPSNNKKRFEQLKAAQEQRLRSRLTLNQRDLLEMLQNEGPVAPVSIKKEPISSKEEHKMADKQRRVTMGINDIAAYLDAQEEEFAGGSLPVPLRSPDMRSPGFRSMMPSPHRPIPDDNDYLEQRARVVGFLN